MSVRALVPASANSSTGVSSSSYSDPYWSNVSLLVNGEVTSFDSNWSNVSLLLDGDSVSGDIDPYWSNVSVCLNGENFTDLSNNRNNITNTGTVTLNTTNKAYGTSSYYFSGSNYLVSDANIANLNLGSGDFTFECWIRFDSFTQYDRPVSIGYGSGSYMYTEGLLIEALSTGSTSILSAAIIGNGVGATVTTPSLSTNTWYHLAFVRANNKLCIFTNGVPSTQTAVTLALNFTTSTRLYLGSWYDGSSMSRYFKGYIDNVRLTKGVARYATGFTPPTSALPTTSADPSYSNVAILLTGDGTNGSTTITDSSSNSTPITSNGNVQISTSQKKYGTGSIAFDGSGDYLSISNNTTFALGTSDFTIELWIYPTTLNAYAGIMCSAANTSPYWTYYTGGWQLNFGASSSAVGFAVSTAAGSYWASTETAAIPLNQWNHIAVTRSGLVINKFVNGSLATSDTMPGNYNFASDGTAVFGKHDIRGGMDFTGYMDDIRITKGVVRYTNGNFTPSGMPINPIIDKAPTNSYPTVNNAVKLSAASKYGNACLSLNGSDASLSFSQTKTVTGTEDYTVEAWVYLLSTTGSPAIIGNATTDGFQFGFNTTYDASGTSNGLRVGRTGTINCENAPYQFLVNTWYHVAVTRSSNTVRFFVNGTLLTTSGTGTSTFSFPTTNTPYVGQYGNSSGFINGYIDDLRITKGVARYTASFTAPSTAIAIPAITDKSSYSLPATILGNAQLSTAVKKYGNYSLIFDGTTDAVVFDSSPLLAFGTSDFTIECWYYPISKATQYPAIYSNSGAWSTNAFVINDRHNNASTGFAVHVYNANSSVPVLVGTTAVANNTWYHVAVVRSDTLLKLFVNGVLESSVVYTGTIDNGTSMPTYLGYDTVNSTTSLNGYIDDFRITQGVARYKSNFTPPISTFFTYSDTTADPYWGNVTLLLDGDSTDVDAYYSNVSLLLKCDGTNGSTSFTDYSNNRATITVNGSAQVSTSVKKYGTGSLYLPSTGSNYLSIADSAAFNLSGGAYTIECWIYPVGDYSNYNTIIAKRVLGGGTTAWELYLRIGTGVLSFYNGTSYESSVTPTANTWNHVAGVYSGGKITLYLNGIDIYSATVANTDQSASIYIGTFTTYSEQFKGYIDDVRITKGVARYPSNFTPPTTELPSSLSGDSSYSNVQLLLLGNGTNGSTTITDSSGTPKTVSVFGNAQISTATKKYGTGSIYLDGSGDYLTVPADSTLYLNGSDYTIDCWVYLTRIGSANSGQFQSVIVQGEGDWLGGPASAHNWQLVIAPTYISFGKAPTSYSANWTPLLNQWVHIAVTGTSTNTITIFINGVSQGTQTGRTALGSAVYSTVIGLGYFGDSKIANYFQGYIDDLRITKGVTRYLSATNFTPPAAPLPVLSITDTSTNAVALSASGSVSINQTINKIGSGSILFDGTSGYLYYPGNTTIFNMGSLNWTVEAWIYLKAMPTSDAWPTNWSSHMVLLGVGSVNAADGFNCMIGQTKLLCQNNDVQYAGTAHGMVINTWYHVAFVRFSNTLMFFVNGVATGTVAFTGAIGTGANTYIGSETGQGAYFNGYIDNLRVTKGIARYTSKFTPSTLAYPVKSGEVTDPYLSNVSLLLTAEATAVDEYWSNVSLLLSGETLTDYSKNHSTVTANGNTRIATNVKKYGTSSIYFDGTGDYLTLASNSVFQLGTNPFTIEMWVYQTSSKDQVYFEIRDDAAGTACIDVGCGVANNLYVWSASSYIFSSTPTITLNTWFHVAYVRVGTTLTIYVNGTSWGSVSFSTNVTSSNVTIGAPIDHRDTTGSWQFNGYIDELRVTKGVARYTANFTPPSAAFTTSGMAIAGDANWSNVSLLLNGDPSTANGDPNWSNVALLINGDTLTDKSNNALTLTAYGNAAINTTTKKYGTGSMYFDGAGDRVTITNSSVATFSGDFTIECWFYCNSYRTAQNWYYNYLWNSVDSSGGNWTYPYTNAAVIYNGTLSVGFAGGSYGSLVSTGFGTSSAITTSTWHHLALVRSSGVLSCYLDGVVVPATSGSTSNTSTLTQTGLIIGDSRWNTGSESWDGYIDDFRITKAARYTSAFTPPTSALPTSSFGPISDSSPNANAITSNGNVTSSAAQIKYGTGSMYFDGTTDYLTFADSAQLQITGGNFTVEMWIYPLTGKQFPCVISNYNSTTWGQSTGMGIYVGHAGISDTTHYKIAWNGVWPKLTSTATIVFNAWTHIALVKNGTTVTLYLNGVADSSFTDSSSSYVSPGWWVGTGGYTPNNSDEFYGYIDDLRITKGIARYTSAFTPPTSAFPLPSGSESGDQYWQSVSLLLNTESATITDSSPNALAITSVGNAQLTSKVAYKYGIGSIYFDGTSDYLSIPYVTSYFDWWTSDFTLECWIYPVTLSSFQYHSSTYNVDISNLIGNSSPTADYCNWSFGPIASGAIALYYYNGTVVTPTASTLKINANEWSHIALTKNSSGFQIWVNGVGNGYTAISGTPQSNAGYPLLMGQYLGTNAYGYVDDLRITKGTARYTSTFTPPATALPILAITDTSPVANTITSYGNVGLSSSAKKYGTNSIVFDGTGDYITAPWSVMPTGTSDFTIEFWKYTAATRTGGILGYRASASDNFQIYEGWPTAGEYLLLNDSTIQVGINRTVPLNTWEHFAWVRSGNKFYYFINGTLQTTVTNSSSVAKSYTSCFVGEKAYSAAADFNGYIDELRITKGIARYTSDFVPQQLLTS